MFFKLLDSVSGLLEITSISKHKKEAYAKKKKLNRNLYPNVVCLCYDLINLNSTLYFFSQLFLKRREEGCYLKRGRGRATARIVSIVSIDAIIERKFFV